ncbi:hypothetical protein AHMF7605_06710 [Adhaeribacter arboris]|uniref:Uncharacterized protein n=1 Tax=Adhaeribacter arboris TaxID=2072846 RepID=A0A2T2YCJ0_9BACT|nr:hypothetical protein [Adhaeribacter arboris]PSR53241.1 hypothetical protein AHMF7605_06710 [Adhaeribacter arboris]
MKENFKLEDLPKSNLYRVPDNYFEKLPNGIMARVTAQVPAAATPWWSTIFNEYRPAFASIFLIISFVAAFQFSQKQPGDFTYNLSNISQQEALEYVLIQDNLESRDIAELNLADTDLAADFSNITPTDILESVDEQQLEEVYFN